MTIEEAKLVPYCHYMGLDSLYQKNQIITPKRKKKKATVQPGNAFEDPAFKPVLEIVKF